MQHCKNAKLGVCGLRDRWGEIRSLIQNTNNFFRALSAHLTYHGGPTPEDVLQINGYFCETYVQCMTRSVIIINYVHNAMSGCILR